MQIQINKKVGDTEFKFIVEGRNAFEALQEAAQVSSIPDYCPFCKGDEALQLEMSKAKSEKGEFTFVYIKCKSCLAKAQIGQFKSGGVFWKRFEKYEGKNDPKKSSDYDVPVIDQD